MRSVVIYMLLILVIAPLAYLLGWLVLFVAWALYPVLHRSKKIYGAIAMYISKPAAQKVLAALG